MLRMALTLVPSPIKSIFISSKGGTTDQEAGEDNKKEADEEKREETSIVTEANEAVKHMRDTAQWVLTIFAALAAALMVGTQLSSLGKLEAPDWMTDNRLGVAFVAGGVALIAIGSIIWFALQVLVAKPISLQETAKDERENRNTEDVRFIESTGLLERSKTIDEFLAKTSGFTRERAEARKRGDQQAIDRANRRLKYHNNNLKSLKALLRYESVRRRIESAKIPMLAAGFLGGIAIGVFAWAANPPDPAETPAPFLLPTQAVARLSEDSRKVWAEDLGTSCDTNSLKVIVLSTDDKTIEVVSVPNDQCALVRFEVPSSEIRPANSATLPES